VGSGSIGVSLAAGVVQPAVSAVSKNIGFSVADVDRHERPVQRGAEGPARRTLSLSTVQYRPLPSHAGLGLSTFYGGLLVMMCGFLGATIINSSVDAGLGYATSEVGPWWRQRLPLSTTRRQTLLAKWALAVPVMLVFTGVLLGGADHRPPAADSRPMVDMSAYLSPAAAPSGATCSIRAQSSAVRVMSCAPTFSSR
jgi:hypothetical protein